MRHQEALRHFCATWLYTLRAALRDRGVVLLLIVAPLIYAFFYPWPYSNEVVQRVPTAVVDLDHSALSRQIVRFAQASPRMRVDSIGSEYAAREALWQGRIAGYAVIPYGLQRQVMQRQGTAVQVFGNGGYALLNKSVLYGFAEAVGTVSAGIEMRQMRARGIPAAQASVLRDPLALRSAALFNPSEGYGSSIVPAVAWLILQQTLLMAAGMFTGTCIEDAQRLQNQPCARPDASPAVWAARVSALAFPSVLVGMLYFGWIFTWHGYARGGNSAGVCVLLVLFACTVSSLGCLLGWLLGHRERVLQVLLFSALPMFFLSGYSWPANALPQPLFYLRWLLPSTTGIEAGVRLDQMGARLGDVALPLLVLAALCAGSFALLCHIGRLRPDTDEKT